MSDTNSNRVIGKLIGNTGDPMRLQVALKDSHSARRGEFVRVMHQESRADDPLPVLGRIVSISRSNILFSEAAGEGLADITLLPGTRVTGETVRATLELVGYTDPSSGQPRIPRRPLDPGSEVLGVDYDFLREFYRFDPACSIHLGNLVGYERGANTVPIFLDVNKLATEHFAVLAMTGAGKSFTVGRIIERMVALHNATVVVFDPHGEYGNAFKAGKVQFSGAENSVEDERDRSDLKKIRDNIETLCTKQGRGIVAYTPDMPEFHTKYAGKNHKLALALDRFDLDEFSAVLPGLTEPQQRVLDAALRYWTKTTQAPRAADSLLSMLTDRLDDLKNWDELSSAESSALNARSAAVVAIRLRRLINDSKSFYSTGMDQPLDIKSIVGRPSDTGGRLVIVDLQGVSDSAKQIIVALMSAEILNAALDKSDKTRPTFLVYEEGHNFAPAGSPSLSRNIIKRIASEGRKFGVGFGIISQRPSRLDPDVTSQCNTLIVMRLKNPDDQKFIVKASDMLSSHDIDELPALSTGEALVSGRSIPAPLLVRVGVKALMHGGDSPDVLSEWNP
ncbi:helicase HerA domain-containing protein [Rubinisphaera italica]|uniref:AAA-like domain protein n=1 Tax=Rubinisphaera italica TaxID=2527969 RepID=A0A5C5XPA5_9PLAN|nr:ATP-binding protein [Rubinisphaera italica]TWT64399.1 AAA-like domain protein [Rubinisphaera italica]